jgi:hypothetical protein
MKIESEVEEEDDGREASTAIELLSEKSPQTERDKEREKGRDRAVESSETQLRAENDSDVAPAEDVALASIG